MNQDLLTAAKTLIEHSGCVQVFGGEITVKSTRAAMKYMAAFEALQRTVKDAERCSKAIKCKRTDCDRPARAGWTHCARHYSAGRARKGA